MLQNALIEGIGASHKRVRWDAEDDVDLSVIDFDAADQGANDLAPSKPVGSFESVLHLRSEVLQTTNQQPELAFRNGCVRELAHLLVECGEALSLASDARLELLFFKEALRIAVDQPGQPLAQFGLL
jgi:hypothetical protein